MLKWKKALFLCLLMVLLPFSGCIDNPADGAEGAAECSTSNTDELFCLDIGMPDEEGILRPPVPANDAHGDHRNHEDDHDHEDHNVDENQTNSTTSRFNHIEAPPGPTGPTGLSFTPTCTSDDLVPTPSSSDLIDYLSASTLQCLRYIWNADVAVISAMDESLLVAITDHLVTEAANFDGSNADGTLQLMHFLRTAGYHDYYNAIPAISSSTIQEVEQVVLAYRDILTLLSMTADAGNILYQFVNVADVYDFAYLVVDLHASGLDALHNPTALASYPHKLAIHGILASISRQFQVVDYKTHPSIDNVTENLSKYATDDDMSIQNSGNTWAVNNAIWALRKHSFEGPDLYEDGFDALVLAQTTHFAASSQIFTTPFLWATKVLDLYYDCNHPAVSHCIDDVVPLLESQLFPYTYEFDDATMVVRTSISMQEIQPLYHASKEVQSQFNRLTSTIQPVDDDPNGVLTMVIYGSRAEYQAYQGFLYGLSTSNGGIYIEPWGTFFTYQRTPQESIYTLEELFRHEYVHYLVARHLIEGMWGESGSIYDGGRMVWFDEGLAEYLTWSTDDQGILPRKILVEQIEDDGANRMTVNQILNADYSSGFKFYRYAGMFFHYLQAHHLGELLALLNHAHNGDVLAFDTAVATMAADTNMEDGYQSYLDDMVNNVSLMDNPFTQYPDPATATPLNLEDLANEFPGHHQNCSVSVIDTNPRFTCGGVVATSSYSNYPEPETLWLYFDAKLSDIQNHLKTLPGVNNFEQVTCRFSGIRVLESNNQGSYYALADYHCDGPMEPGTYTRADPVTHIDANMDMLRLTTDQECLEQSTGVIVCTDGLTTPLYPLGTDYAVMLERFMRDIGEVENQLYAMSPSYYNDMDCYVIGTPIERESTNSNGVYVYGDFGCTINL